MKVRSFQIIQQSGTCYPGVIVLTDTGDLWEGLLSANGVWTKFNQPAESRKVYKPIPTHKGEKLK